jgi:hypothetical protein
MQLQIHKRVIACVTNLLRSKPLFIIMKNKILVRICWGILLLAPVANLTIAQGCPSGVQINAYVQVVGNGLNNTCSYSIIFSITGWNHNWKSYQISASCDNGPFQVVKSCVFLPNNPPESGITVPFMGTSGGSVVAKFEFGTSNGNCLGGGNCESLLPLAVLPVKLGYFQVTGENNHPNIGWSAEYEADVKRYVVERSTDGLHFSALDSIFPVPGSTVHHYRYADSRFTGNLAYYRVRAIEKDAQNQFTETRMYKTGYVAPITAWPVPVKNQLHFYMKSQADYRFRVSSVSGDSFFEGKAKGVGTLNTTSFPAGTYVLQIYSSVGVSRQLFIVEK